LISSPQLPQTEDRAASGAGISIVSLNLLYGKPLQATAPVTDFVYAGMFYNADSGLNLTQFRGYDPIAGRWLSRDPIGEATDRAGNLYAYVGGIPISRRDALGLQEEELFEREIDEEREELREENREEYRRQTEGMTSPPSRTAFTTEDDPNASYVPLAEGEQTACYGPFHRLGDSEDIINEIVNSGTLMGRPLRNYQAGGFPYAKAYNGPLREGAKGFEFTTPLAPAPGYQQTGNALWGEREGATINGEWASIPVTVTKTQP